MQRPGLILVGLSGIFDRIIRSILNVVFMATMHVLSELIPSLWTMSSLFFSCKDVIAHARDFKQNDWLPSRAKPSWAEPSQAEPSRAELS